MRQHIAVILTCFNRKGKTLHCISLLYNFVNDYQKKQKRSIDISIFLTDDGCTDGTSDAIKESFPDKDIFILKGTGNLFWAGGMRLAWKAALNSEKKWDYFLLVNDDVELLPNCFDQLFAAVDYSKKAFGTKAIVSGIMMDSANHKEETYGGKIWVNKLLGTGKHLKPTGAPQRCDMAHANILLVPSYVVGTIGIFCDGYIHGGADHDYSLLANRNGIPVLVTAEFCGICENDHRKKTERPIYVASLPFVERRVYFKNPRHSIHDHLLYVKRNMPWRYPVVYIGYLMTIYTPQVYIILNKLRHFNR